MKFSSTKIPGVWKIEIERNVDERGWFARTWDVQEFFRNGINFEIVQSSLSLNKTAGTLRGMHYQADPYGEAKLVRCTRGAMFDVVVDLRPQSSTYCEWEEFHLSSENGIMLYIPVGCAHGFQTLQDGTEVTYDMSSPYLAEYQRGVRWDDPLFSINWPNVYGRERVISKRDRGYPDFQPRDRVKVSGG